MFLMDLFSFGLAMIAVLTIATASATRDRRPA
jgi:hypothetical protein